MAATNKLTQLQVRNATSKIGDGGGLWLQVKLSGSKSWLFRYRLHNRDREMGLGAWPDVSLSSARILATECRNLKNSGIDPINHRNKLIEDRIRSKSLNKTFNECVPAYIDAIGSEWKNTKHKQQWENTLKTYAYPKLGDIPVSDITTDDILATLKPIWLIKTETASRVRQRIGKVLDWAKVMKYRQGENPARWKGHLSELLPAPSKVKTSSNHSALPYLNTPAFMHKLRERNATSAKALELCILTATRTSEIIGAKWDEIDLNAQVWTIPATRMKAQKEHEVPLSDAAMHLLEQLPRVEGMPYVFMGGRRGKPLSNMAMLKMLKEDMNYNGVTVHGFRSTFRDWGAEQTHYPREVQEAALAHQLKDKAEAAYFRSNLLDKRRAMMNDWADYVGNTKKSAKVIPIKKLSSQD